MKSASVAEHRQEVRRLVAEAPDEPVYCEFKRELAYQTKKQKAELVKDVSSFANIDLEALGGYGYLIFGVSDEGDVVGVGESQGDASSDMRKIVNGYLDRSVDFEYLTCEVVDAGTGAKKKIAAIVVQDSKRRPHVVSRELKEQQGNKSKFWLREGEVWTRKTGGRELATSEDFDAMYEGKLRKLVEDKVRPLADTVSSLQRDVLELKASVPEISFGFAVTGFKEPQKSVKPAAVVDNLIPPKSWRAIREDRKEARRRANTHYENSPFGTSLSRSTGGEPSATDYQQYITRLDRWIEEIRGLLFFEFAIYNTGQSTAEDVEVVLEVPTVLWPMDCLPEKPEPPRDHLYFNGARLPLPRMGTKQTSPDSLLGPYMEEYSVSHSKPVPVNVKWEVGKLYHNRPLATHSDEDDMEGLVIPAGNYRQALEEAGGEIQLPYTVHAANLKMPVSGTLVLN